MKYCILSYITQTPPSRYEYQSDAEFEQAMSEWCRDFEPQYEVIYVQDGQNVRVPFASRDEALAYIGRDRDKILASKVRGRHIDCPVFNTHAPVPGDGKYDHGVSYRDGDHSLLGIR